MKPEQIEQVRFVLANPRYAAWPASPVVPGDWRDLAPGAALQTLISINDWLEEHSGTRNLAMDWTIDRVRVRSLICYDNARLVEFGGHGGYGRPGLINVIVHQEGMALMNGTSGIIHRLNMNLPPQLETDAHLQDYLSLFMNWVRGEYGRFQPVGDLETLRTRLQPDATDLVLPETVGPFERSPVPADNEAIACFTGSVLYGDSLYRATMAISSDGQVEMLEDDAIVTDLPVREEFMTGPLLCSRP